MTDHDETPVVEGQRWQHVKRRTSYEMVGVAELQNGNVKGLREGASLAVYRGDDGKLWAREEGEFTDGRFRLQHSGKVATGGTVIEGDVTGRGPHKLITYPSITTPSPDVSSSGGMNGADVERLLDALAKVMPVETRDTPDYAELYFGQHQTQAMTMKPQDWRDIGTAYTALRPTIQVETE